MPDASAEAEAEHPAAPSLAARRLFVLRGVEMGWTVAYSLLARAFIHLKVDGGSFSGLNSASDLIWIVVGALQLGLLLGLRREVGAHPAAGLLRAAFVLTAVNLAWSALTAAAAMWSGDGLKALGLDGKGPSILFMSTWVAFDIVFWLALERLLGRVSPALRAAFFALRLSRLGLSSLYFVLPLETYRALTRTGTVALALPWVRILLSLGWNATVLVALHGLALRARAPTSAGVVEARPDATNDLIVGALWLGGGLLVTLAAYSAAAAGGGGRYVVTTGAIVYGGMRLLRGISRLGAR